MLCYHSMEVQMKNLHRWCHHELWRTAYGKGECSTQQLCLSCTYRLLQLEDCIDKLLVRNLPVGMLWNHIIIYPEWDVLKKFLTDPCQMWRTDSDSLRHWYLHARHRTRGCNAGDWPCGQVILSASSVYLRLRTFYYPLRICYLSYVKFISLPDSWRTTMEGNHSRMLGRHRMRTEDGCSLVFHYLWNNCRMNTSSWLLATKVYLVCTAPTHDSIHDPYQTSVSNPLAHHRR